MGESNAETTVESAEAKQQLANKNGKKSEGGAGGSFFTWFIVLALLGVWTSVAVVWFDLVDYQGVVGKLGSYDADGDGDFDMEDAKVLLDEKPAEVDKKERLKDSPVKVDPAGKLKEALKRQLALIHERVEAKKIAKLALAEVRSAIAKEEEERQAEARREEEALRARERTEAKIRKAMERIEREEMEKAEAELKERAKRDKGEKKEKAAEKDKRHPGRKRGKDDDDEDDDNDDKDEGKAASRRERRRHKEARVKDKKKSHKETGKGGKK